MTTAELKFANGKTVLFTIVTLLGLTALLMLAGCGGAFGPTSGGIDFTLSASPGSQAVVAGNGASFRVAVNPTPMIGFVNLGINGLPAGVQASFSPGFNVDGSRTLNIFTTQATPPGTSQLAITASDETGSRTANVTLAIAPAADFTLSVTPNGQTVRPGKSVNYTVNVNFTGNGSGPVTLSVAGLPPAATASFDRNPISGSGSAILTVTASAAILNLVTSFNVVGSDSVGTIKTPVGISLLPADFSLSQFVGPMVMNAGGTVTGQVDVDGLFATPGTVSLNASAVPGGVTATFNPSTVTGVGSSLISIAADAAAPPGDYVLSLEGVDASGRNTTSLQFSIVPGNSGVGFFLSASPSAQDAILGNSAFFNLKVNTPSGTIPPLTFQVSGMPDPASATVSPTSVPGTYSVVIATGSLTTSGIFFLTINANGPNGGQSIPVTLFVDQPPPVDP